MFGLVIGIQLTREDESSNDAKFANSTQTTVPEPVSESRWESENAGVGAEPEFSQQAPSAQASNLQSNTVYANESQTEDDLQIRIDTYADYEDEYARVSQNPDYPTLGYRMLEINARRPDTEFTPEDVLQALAEPSAWQPLESPPEEWLDQAEEDGRKFVQFNRTKIETLVAGDLLEIPIENTGATYVMHVKQVEANVDGNITWRGTIDSGSGQYPVSLTQNASNFTVGGFSTPEGYFMLQATNDAGWIVASRGVAGDDSGVPDYIIPDIK